MAPWLVALSAVAGLFALCWLALVAWLWRGGRREDARALAGLVPDCAVFCARALRDARVPRSSKLLVAAFAAYLAVPIDLVPDVVPVAGQLDDVLLAGLVLRRLVRSAGREVVAELWPGPAASRDLLLRLARAS